VAVAGVSTPEHHHTEHQPQRRKTDGEQEHEENCRHGRTAHEARASLAISGLPQHRKGIEQQVSIGRKRAGQTDCHTRMGPLK
jgi:hypothetical protein